MATCKNCGRDYSVWKSARRDALCNDCGAKFDQERFVNVWNDAERNLEMLLSRLAAGRKVLAYGVGLWRPLGHRISQTASLWAGRALIGVFGDIVNAQTHLLALVALSDDRSVHFARIGECSEITPAAITGASLDDSSIVAVPSSGVVVSDDNDKMVLGGLADGTEVALVFPVCGVPHNARFPLRLKHFRSPPLSAGQPVVTCDTNCKWCGERVQGTAIEYKTLVGAQTPIKKEIGLNAWVDAPKLMKEDIVGFVCPACGVTSNGCAQSVRQSWWSGSSCSQCGARIPEPIVIVSVSAAARAGLTIVPDDGRATFPEKPAAL